MVLKDKGHRGKDRKNKKEKRNNARLQRNATYKLHATWYPLFLLRPVAKKINSKNSEEATVGNQNSEGAVAKSASGDSPFTQGRRNFTSRLNLPLLAGGDCADWTRKQRFYRRATTLTTEHQPFVQANATSYHRQTATRKHRCC
jgi:hypothetical protein